ncbi:MAG: PEP-CTERM sorting domain-containing protein [Opitutus sp.]|nr:PEP-CTERM sorting domain-containing protein [Opitutus sp.]MCS6247078.1 PEP-CTERM sorting domain-containing protein [Opitutus sp.]MCS6274769.1 PEP-CTERM sorting domain-containing protein [Opitutus sp.]MCS6275877.1 PEP-CTERM sorting domain-containing protein [Opitutus sp.]MCS6300973.1 PEP-CTERM sorting domain-containing protein [Opitutus sp.]
MSHRAYTQHSPHPFTAVRANGVRVAVLAALLAMGGTLDLLAIAVTDTTGWTAWNTFGTTTPMTDGNSTDKKINNQAADFTGSISQQAGALNGTSSIMWQVNTATTGTGAFPGVIGLGVGLTDNANAINFVILLNGSTPAVQFASMGTMTNAGAVASSPSTLAWAPAGNAAGTANSSNALSAGASATSTYTKTTAGVVTFALSYATLQQAIRSYAGSAFSSFVVDDLTHLNFVAFTDSSSTYNAQVNGDLFATSNTNKGSTATFTSLGMGTTLIRPGGGPIPEPAAIYQLGGFIGVGLLGFFWRRRRAAKQAV